MSTLLCTGFVKFVVTQYLSNETLVHSCLLDLSKAFDLDDHNLLFRRVLDMSLPLPIVCLLITWYRNQNMRVWWNQTLSDIFVTMVCAKGANFVRNVYRRALAPAKAAWCGLSLEASLCGCSVLRRWPCSSWSFSSCSQVDVISPQTLSWFEI